MLNIYRNFFSVFKTTKLKKSDITHGKKYLEIRSLGSEETQTCDGPGINLYNAQNVTNNYQ